MRRIIGSIVVFISILVLPYWIYLPVLFLTIIIIPFYWEGLLFAFLIQILYSDGVGIFSLITSLLVLSTLVVLIAFLPIRENLRSYA